MIYIYCENSMEVCMHTPGGDTEWDDMIEELPQTGTSIVLR